MCLAYSEGNVDLLVINWQNQTCQLNFYENGIIQASKTEIRIFTLMNGSCPTFVNEETTLVNTNHSSQLHIHVSDNLGINIIVYPVAF